jgi:threonine/homoserine/homoserine lactone efflux protein
VRRALFEGVVVEALNVKTALFFLAFLPQFVAPGEPLVPQLVLLGGICVGLNTCVDVLAVFAADRLLKSQAARAARARLLTRVSGVTMLGLGVWLALARREA